MRVWHLLLMIFASAVMLAVANERIGQVFLVMFLTGIAEVVCGTTALLNLFKSIGAIGKAEKPAAYVEAILATALILMIGTIAMTGLMFIGATLLKNIAS
ncbi:MAG: hypothetical protein NVSMB14_04160 [Isosphaeraceae bacterium]